MKRFETTLFNRHKGAKVLLCGEGSSIDEYPLHFYVDWDGIIVGINRIKLKFVPDYWLALDVMRNKVEDCNKQQWYQWKAKHRSAEEGLGKRDGLIEPGNSSLTINSALSICYQLGASEIYLIGIDFCLGKNGKAHYNIREEMGGNHLVENYNKFLTKRCHTLDEQIHAYQNNGVKIYDLSPFGLLEGVIKKDLRKD